MMAKPVIIELTEVREPKESFTSLLKPKVAVAKRLSKEQLEKLRQTKKEENPPIVFPCGFGL